MVLLRAHMPGGSYWQAGVDGSRGLGCNQGSKRYEEGDGWCLIAALYRLVGVRDQQ